MSDSPGFTNVSVGITYAINLAFKGTLIDTSSGSKLLQENSWTVAGSTTPTNIEGVSAVRLTATDRILMAYYTQNVESGAPELHIIISRPSGRPPLAPGSLEVTPRDSSGQALQLTSAPLVHEVSGRLRTTVNVVYTLVPGSNIPTVVHLAINGGLVKLRVQVR